GADPRALAFSPAETSLLFPAPVSRRALVQWKLWRAQGALLVNVLLWVVVLRGGAELAHGAAGGAGGTALRRGAALWLLFTTLYLHRLGASLRTAAWRAAGDDGRTRPGRWRWRAAQALVLAAVGAVAFPLWQARDALREAWGAGLGAFVGVVDAALARDPARWLLAPARTLLDAVRAAPLADVWPAAVGLSVAVAALHYLWVVRTDVAVHELALDAVERRVAGGLAPWRARRAAPRGAAGRGTDDAPRDDPAFAPRRAPRLAPVGHPAGAILWKNGVAAWRSRGLVGVVVMYAVLAVAVLALAARDTVWAELATVLLGVWSAMLLVGGPLVVRTDLRQDLVHLATLRALPMRGRDLVGAEVLASTLALTAAQLGLLLVMLLASLGVRVELGASVDERLAFAAAITCALPGVNLASFVLHNGAALLFPAWVRPAGTARGVEATGQGLVTTGLTLAGLAVLLAVPGALAFGVLTVARPALGTWAFAPAALVLTLGTAVELWPVLGWLGGVFERTDPNEVGAAA
ncbi:MAG TPA: hypothetical protein VEZ47_03930, partial [Gemmatirosa sp.]|nr:hypothetical protein [Gemmatirosa sp.]